MTLLLSLVAFVASAAGVRAFLGISRRRFLDLPGARSSHSVPTPTGGGFPAVAVFLIVSSVAVALNAVSAGPRFWACLLCGGALSLVGLLDDVLDLPSSARFLVHALVAGAVVCWLGHPGPVDGPASSLAATISVGVVAGLINAFNFMDGIDALVGSTGVLIVFCLGVFSGDPIWFILAASYSGFLVFNLPPARIFMGDAGSTVLGGLVGVALLSGGAELEIRHTLILAPLIGDSAYTILRRTMRRENILRAHHSHLYQRLLRAGHSHGAISAGYALSTLVIALLVAFYGNTGAAIGAVGCAVAVVAIEQHVSRRGVPFTRPQRDSSSA